MSKVDGLHCDVLYGMTKVKTKCPFGEIHRRALDAHGPLDDKTRELIAHLRPYRPILAVRQQDSMEPCPRLLAAHQQDSRTRHLDAKLLGRGYSDGNHTSSRERPDASTITVMPDGVQICTPPPHVCFK